MKRLNCFLIFNFIIISCIHSQLPPLMIQVKSDTLISWNQYFGDEFSKAHVDETRWYRGYPWGGLSFLEDEWADPDNSIINNGVLELYAKKTNELRKFPDWMIDTNAMKKHNKKLVDGKYQLKYTGSAIWSKQQFKYGYFECRCKTPEGKGLWPAFWLYGGNPNDEIDFMELKGEKKKEIHIDVHCPTNCDRYKTALGLKKNWGDWIKVSSDLNKDWNIISGLWLPGSVIFYVNGDVVGFFKGDFTNPMNLIANLAVAADNGPFGPGPDNKTLFPAKMEVDYIRVWKPVGDSSFSVRRINSFENDDTPKETTVKENRPMRRKTKRFMLPKKQTKNDQGYVSFYPMNENNYVVTINSKSIEEIEVNIVDSSGNNLKSIKLNQQYNKLDLSDIKTNNFKLVCRINNKNIQFNITR